MAEMDMGLSPRNDKKKKKKKKQSLWKSIVSGLIPGKGDNKSEVARKIVFLAALATLVTSVVMITAYNLRYIKLGQDESSLHKNNSNSSLNNIMDVHNSTPTGSPNDNKDGHTGELSEEFAYWYNENNDFVGKLIVPGTNIDELVVQTGNNDDYLHANFYGEYDFSGTLFADYEGKISAEEMPHNTIIYGHNMRWEYRFTALHNYTDSIEFLKISPLIRFDTIYQDNIYKIMSVFITNIYEDHGEVFHYSDKVYFNSKAEFYDFVLECEDRSIYETGVDVEYGDEFLTLSTCDKTAGLDLRLVIVARKVRPNESPDVDTDKIVRKDSIKYFKVYEDIFGKQWHGRTWDISLVKGMDDYIAENHLEDDPADY